MNLVRWKVCISMLMLFVQVSITEAKNDMRISDIAISGNAKTKNSVILSMIKVKIGDIYIEGLEKDIEQIILNSKMFYDIKVEAEKKDEEVKLKIQLKDKWSLIPFPIISVRDDERRYGIAIVESNLFGYHKRLLGTFFYENDKFNQALAYHDKNLLDSNYRFLFIIKNMNLVRDEWNDKEKINSYYQSTAGTDIGLGYAFNDDIAVSLIHRFHYFKYDNRGDSTSRKPDRGRESMLAFLVDIDKADYEEDFTKGFVGRILLERDLEFLGSDYSRTIFSWRFNYFLNPILRHNLVFISSGAFGSDLPYGYRFRIGQQGNEYCHELRGYRRDRFETDRALISTVEYRIPVYSFREATFSFVTFVDNAIFRNAYQKFNLADSKSDIGVSLRAYLKRITAPVFQIYCAYGISDEEFLGGISLGMAF